MRVTMCSKCKNTGVLAYTDITINFDNASVSLKRPELCMCDFGLHRFMDWNHMYITDIKYKKDEL